MKYVGQSEIDGTITAPPSKSMMVRALAAATLARGVSEIRNPSFCADALAALNISKNLGAAIKVRNEAISIEARQTSIGDLLDCRESGLCIRMFAAIAALYDKEIVLDAHGSLCSRPIDMVLDPLLRMGVSCVSNNGFPPIRLRGPLSGGIVAVDSSTSSQFLSGLLMALPLCTSDSSIEALDLKSHPYVRMTIELLKSFGVKISVDQGFSRFEVAGGQNYTATKYNIEGDYSGAAFLLVAGAIAGRVKTINLKQSSFQADRQILAALTNAGAQVEICDGEVRVEKQQLCAFEFDATSCPDLFPPLVALACNCKGTSLISGVDRLKRKESDRASTLLTEFSKMGAKLFIEGNRLIIEGSDVTGAEVESHNDHRIAMACAIGALRTKKGVTINDHNCIEKSYPDFFRDLELLGATIR